MSEKKYATNFIMSDGQVVFVKDEEVDNKVDKIEGMGLSQNSFTDAEKSKLSGIASGAQVNVIEAVQKNGANLTVSNKTVNVTVPTKTSDLTNDSEFATTSAIPTRVSQLTNDADYASKKYVNSAKMSLAGRKFVFIGDSYGDGYTPDGSVEGWCDRVKTYLGLTTGTNFWANHAGGACFGRSDNLSFEYLLNNVGVPANEKGNITDIVIGGGYNDSAWSVESINSGMTRVENIVNAQYPNATVWIIAMGWAYDSGVRNILATNYDEAYSRTAHAKKWVYKEIFEQLQYLYYFSSDGIHPNGNGQYLIANCTAGLLLGSDISKVTQRQSVLVNGVNWGHAWRSNEFVYVVFGQNNISGNWSIGAHAYTKVATISNPYIFGASNTSQFSFVWPAILQSSGTGFYSVPLSATFKRETDGTVGVYVQTNGVSRDGQGYLPSTIIGIQSGPCYVAIPVQVA